ncbi:hypothetical protein P168DRAFT_321209 [Aspergillus campestris IBT 28561]|uniref:Uncharacterized protein n=1 Tax=Aspergillus campestris (strain IBT 28561) TaxID=1392248 RepID=A0A2I1CVI3_ASPC2|nr:uncharacterized protein P168DRAFT_321209 [Aspergillus campestris IBT 28561]PKY01630.1 hypothetical protein P168DRAFT_321209 [Aspergillus campestris IBT 28561]
MADIVQMYGPGMSFYRVGETPLQDKPAAKPSESALRTYNASLDALHTSNQNLEHKMLKIRTGTLRLSLDLIQLEQRMHSLPSDMLITWQANVLTRLIEVIYERKRWKLPGAITVGDREHLAREDLNRVYSVAARKVRKEVLKLFGLSVEYLQALQKYDEVVQFRSESPFQTECAFAVWMVSEKENHSNLCRFWGRLYPLCYGRTVEESSVVF